MAAAGVDASNTDAGTVVLLPLRPGRVGARGCASALAARHRAQRRRAGHRHRRPRLAHTARPTSPSAPPGSTCCTTTPAGTDPHGNELAVTAPAVADELAAAADLVKGKLDRRPGRRGPRAGRAGAAARRARPGRRRAGARRRRRTCSGSAPARRCSSALHDGRPRAASARPCPADELVVPPARALGRRPAACAWRTGRRVTARLARHRAGAGRRRRAAAAAAFALGWRAEPARPSRRPSRCSGSVRATP